VPAKSRIAADHLLDITGEVCPITFVKTKLALEKMAPGQVLAVDLKGAEPLGNVPRSATDAGHAVLEIEDRGSGVHRVLIRRA
jgi:tRNA 2-thiouridine synthesizing protein A